MAKRKRDPIAEAFDIGAYDEPEKLNKLLQDYVTQNLVGVLTAIRDRCVWEVRASSIVLIPAQEGPPDDESEYMLPGDFDVVVPITITPKKLAAACAAYIRDMREMSDLWLDVAVPVADLLDSFSKTAQQGAIDIRKAAAELTRKEDR